MKKTKKTNTPEIDYIAILNASVRANTIRFRPPIGNTIVLFEKKDIDVQSLLAEGWKPVDE